MTTHPSAHFALFATLFTSQMLLLLRPCSAFPGRLMCTGRHQNLVVSRQSTRQNSALKSSSSSRRDYAEILDTIEHAATQAGAIMQETTGRIKVSSTKANIKDLVTESDVKCQQIIESTIKIMHPSDIFLGEESVATGQQASMEALETALESCGEDGLVFICDPIDGTTNFQAGLPLFGASIGVVARNPTTREPEIVVGCIYNPILDEMVSAIRNQGAFLNGQRIVKRDTSTTTIQLNQALVNVGFPVTQQSTLQASARAVAALATQVRGLRMIASAAQVLSWIAQDKMQAYISWNLNAWDIAAGMLIVEESGGCLVNFDGSPATISSRDIIMTSNSGGEHLAQEILSILRDNDCLEY